MKKKVAVLVLSYASYDDKTKFDIVEAFFCFCVLHHYGTKEEN